MQICMIFYAAPAGWRIVLLYTNVIFYEYYAQEKEGTYEDNADSGNLDTDGCVSDRGTDTDRPGRNVFPHPVLV